MAKNFKRHSRGGSFRKQNIGDGGLRSLSEQQSQIIDAMKEQRARSQQYGNEFVQSLRGVHVNEQENRKLIQNLESKVYSNKLENVKIRADREVDALEGQAKEYGKKAKFWEKFSTTYSKEWGKLAQGAVAFRDMRLSDAAFKEFLSNPAVQTYYDGMANDSSKLNNKFQGESLADQQKLIQSGQFDLSKAIQTATKGKNLHLFSLNVAKFFKENKEAFLSDTWMSSGDNFRSDHARDTLQARAIQFIETTGLSINSAGAQEILKIATSWGNAEQTSQNLKKRAFKDNELRHTLVQQFHSAGVLPDIQTTKGWTAEEKLNSKRLLKLGTLLELQQLEATAYGFNEKTHQVIKPHGNQALGLVQALENLLPPGQIVDEQQFIEDTLLQPVNYQKAVEGGKPVIASQTILAREQSKKNASANILEDLKDKIRAHNTKVTTQMSDKEKNDIAGRIQATQVEIEALDLGTIEGMRDLEILYNNARTPDERNAISKYYHRSKDMTTTLDTHNKLLVAWNTRDEDNGEEFLMIWSMLGDKSQARYQKMFPEDIVSQVNLLQLEREFNITTTSIRAEALEIFAGKAKINQTGKISLRGDTALGLHSSINNPITGALDHSLQLRTKMLLDAQPKTRQEYNDVILKWREIVEKGELYKITTGEKDNISVAIHFAVGVEDGNLGSVNDSNTTKETWDKRYEEFNEGKGDWFKPEKGEDLNLQKMEQFLNRYPPLNDQEVADLYKSVMGEKPLDLTPDFRRYAYKIGTTPANLVRKILERGGYKVFPGVQSDDILGAGYDQRIEYLSHKPEDRSTLNRLVAYQTFKRNTGHTPMNFITQGTHDGRSYTELKLDLSPDKQWLVGSHYDPRKNEWFQEDYYLIDVPEYYKDYPVGVPE